MWAVRGVRDASQCVPQLLDGEDDRLRLDELSLRREPRREGEQAVEPLGERARGAGRVDAPAHKLERLQVVCSSRGLELVELPEAAHRELAPPHAQLRHHERPLPPHPRARARPRRAAEAARLVGSHEPERDGDHLDHRLVAEVGAVVVADDVG